MRRGHNDRNLGSRLAKMAGVLLVAGAGVLVLTQLDTIRRYLGIRRMSARRHPRPPGTERQGTASPPRWGTSHWPIH